MKFIISLIIWVVSTALTIALFFVSLFLAFVLFPFDRQKRIVHRQCFWWADAIIGFNPFWDVKVYGLENIDPSQTYVITANHQSLADIVVIYKTRLQFKWVAKESLFKLPFIGWCLSLGRHIKLSRGKFGSIKKIYKEAASWLRHDMSVLFFPEGTRSRTDNMNEFQNGAFKLAIKEQKPVLPILIQGTREAIPRGDWVFKAKVKGTVRVLPPVDTKCFAPGDFGLLRDLVFNKLKST
ncbi:MAG: lysophospholipid acyltransferase family protein [Candidatus Omnitrophica bacterium]|nr:lysophospholipid acyltransferase family protein [Candidatus Omnitrophota bacterium]